MTGHADKRACKAVIEGTSREWCDAGNPHRTIEGLVVMSKAFVVRTIPRLVDIEERHDKPRSLVVPTDAACCLDVFGVHFRLAHDSHESQPGDVETDRDHVCCNSAIN